MSRAPILHSTRQGSGPSFLRLCCSLHGQAHAVCLAKCCLAGAFALQVWQLQQDGRLAWLRSLGRFAAGVHGVAAAAGRPWLLTASLDGFVVAWSTDNWQQLFRWGMEGRAGRGLSKHL